MKIEMAPWIESYQVEMGKTYTELTLEKIENEPAGPANQIVENYADLFTNSKDKKKRKRVKGKKVLAKGDPGIGKSTFSKKVAWDWAKGIFTIVSVLFFVSLKLVKQGDAIENVIIEQNPPLKGLQITKEKLMEMFQTFGDRCLVVLDGHDELKHNDDVQGIIEGSKLSCCHILMTSRPHSTDEIERHFQTVVKIQGFSSDRARDFVSNHLEEPDKINAVCELNTKSFLSTDTRNSSPMLLLFICILVNHDELKLTKKDVPVGEIYWRLARCIFRKYCVRVGKKFEENNCFEVLKNIGNLACEMLFSGVNTAQYDKIKEIVGDDAFEYGILIGNKDHRLFCDETADIYLTFPHTTIQEFFGAFYFINSLDRGESLQSFLGDGTQAPIFMANYIFLQFCLWFLSDGCSFRGGAVSYDGLISNCVETIDKVQLDMLDMPGAFEALKISDADKKKEGLLVRFVLKVLTMCQNVKELYLSTDYPVEWILESIGHLLPSLEVIGPAYVTIRLLIMLDIADVKSGNDVAIAGDTQNHNDVNSVLNTFSKTSKRMALYLLTGTVNEKVDLSKYSLSHVTKLYLASKRIHDCRVIGQQNLPCCRLLTSLSFVELNLDERALVSLSDTTRKGNLPVLSDLCFKDCGSSLKGKVCVLLNTKWPTLTSLNLKGSYLDKSDLHTLTCSLSDMVNGSLPKLTSLSLDFGVEPNSQIHEVTDIYDKSQRQMDSVPFSELFRNQLANISKLNMHGIDTEVYKNFIAGLNDGNFPNLEDLGISLRQHANVEKHIRIQRSDEAGQSLQTDPVYDQYQTKETELLTAMNPSFLADLTLKRFIFEQGAFPTLWQLAKKSKLNKIDISHSSGVTGNLSVLLRHSLPSLNSLILSDCGLNSQDLCSLAQASVESRLPQLTHLDISENPGLVGQLDSLFCLDEKWQHLVSLHVQQRIVSDNDFQTIVDKVQANCLSSLQVLEVSTCSGECLRSTRVKWQSLREVHVNYPHGNRVERLDNEFRITEPVAEAVEQGLFPKLVRYSSNCLPGKGVNVQVTIANTVNLVEANEAKKASTSPELHEKIVKFMNTAHRLRKCGVYYYAVKPQPETWIAAPESPSYATIMK